MDNDSKKIYKEREKYRQKAFLMLLEVGVIIALPAVVFVFIGKYLDKNSGNFYTQLLLFLAFILSWAIIIRKYIKFDKKMKDIDAKIKELKNKEDIHV